MLTCENGMISSLDISKNRKLTYLRCSFNDLTSLDITNNPLLYYIKCSGNSIASLDVSNNPLLKTLICQTNKLTSLDLTNNKKLEDLTIYENCIYGSAMDNLVNSLPENKTGRTYRFWVICLHNDENNVCTTEQVKLAKEKGWTSYAIKNGCLVEYTGSDPSGINGIMLDEEKINRIFDLSGKPLPKPRKGINIIDGKKVILR
jgi:hypothetical protein